MICVRNPGPARVQGDCTGGTSMKRPVIVVATVVAAALLGACSSSGANQAATGTTVPVPLVAAADVPAAPSAGCSATTPVPAGDQTITLAAGAEAGQYFRHVPPAHDGTTPVPLVMDLHGYSESAAAQVTMSQLSVLGDTKGFVTLTPEIVRDPARWDTALDGTDITWLGQVLDQAEQTLCLDQNRVYVAGLSNGAFMTSSVACAFSERFAAAAPVAGIRDIDGCAPSRPVPVIAFHGTADQFVTYDGSLGPAAAKLPAPDGSGRTLGEIGAVDPSVKGPTIPEITADWAQRNGCGTTPTESVVTVDVTLLSFPCPPGADVELYRVTDGGHAWPGSKLSMAVANVVGKTTDTIDADTLIWDFFVAHPLRPAA